MWAEATLDALPQAVVTMQPVRDDAGEVVDFVYVWANEAACRYNGLTREETLGRRLFDVFPGMAATPIIKQYLDVLETGRTLLQTDVIYDNERRGNEPLRYDVRIAKAGSAVVVSWQDVTDRFLAQQELAESVRTDSLTRLTSRSEGLSLLRRALDEKRGDRRLGIAYLDVDGLKAVNDEFGHGAGDAFLVSIAVRVRAAVRGDDVVVRLGGDEILVLLHGVDTLESAFGVCDKIREAVAAPTAVDGRQITTSLSVGLTLAEPGDTVGSVLERADSAMYRAKREGGDRVVVG